MKKTLVAVVMMMAAMTCRAQEAPCGLRTMTEGAKPIYPAIAKAAHITGAVIMLAEFSMTGEVTNVQILNGPIMLQKSAVDSVKTWRANAYSGPRVCPVVVRYELSSTKITVYFQREDVQHLTVYAEEPVIYSNSSYIAHGN